MDIGGLGPELCLLAVALGVRERLEFTRGEMVRGASFKFNYHLLREYGNSRIDSVIKAALSRAGFRVCLDYDMPYSLAIWYALINIHLFFDKQ